MTDNQEPLRIYVVPQGSTPLERARMQHEREAAAYKAEMEALSRGGSDQSGNEKWRQIMRALGRR